MDNEEIKDKKKYVEEMARDIFTHTVSHNGVTLDKMEIVAKNSFEYANFFYTYKRSQ